MKASKRSRKRESRHLLEGETRTAREGRFFLGGMNTLDQAPAGEYAGQARQAEECKAGGFGRMQHAAIAVGTCAIQTQTIDQAFRRGSRYRDVSGRRSASGDASEVVCLVRTDRTGSG